MKNTLKQLKNIFSDNCTTIILNTHRTAPDNKQDSLLLKNLIKEAEDRLTNEGENKNAPQIIENLHKLADSIDHSYNLESLILFANESTAKFVRLPIPVENRVIIDNTFATRDLVRALNQETNYFILVLSQQKTRLIEAFNDKVVKEFSEPFPIENTQFYSTSRAEAAIAQKQTNLIAEYFNRIDKEVVKIVNENPLPVLIAMDESNYSEYLKIADRKEIYLEQVLAGNRLEEKAPQIVNAAWEMVKEYAVANNNARKLELKNAVSNGKFMSDVNDIWRALQEGRIQTLFIEKGLFQPGLMEKDQITLVSEEKRTKSEVVDDIYDEMIEMNMSKGGDTVFLPQGELTKFNGFGAITRY